MKLNNNKFDELIENARAVFIDELEEMVERISSIINYYPEGLPAEDVKDTLIFFHKISGTASTLGLERLSHIGFDNERMLKGLIDSGNGMDEHATCNIQKSIDIIKHELELVKPSVCRKETDNPGCGYTSMPDMGKILLIDDDIVMLKLLENAFTSEGYTVYICDDSLSAMDVIAVCKPDVILLDIMMPKCDGYEILSRIKANPKYFDIFVIFLSAIDDTENKIKGMKAGVDDYITKPFIVAEVISRVEMILKRANKLREKLIRDSMTGAYSRCHFNDRIRDELDRFNRYRTTFSVAFIDIDNFKSVNDRYGHLAGDFVLQRFVSYMAQNLRECDCIFRYGGEEFAIVLPDTCEDNAFIAIDRLREGFNSEAVRYGGNEFSVTFSCGIKQVDKGDKTVNQLLSGADEAMYAAKSMGRNMVKRFSTLSSESKDKKTLLLVDDENTILKLLESRMSEIGYNTLLATNGREAINITGNAHPDAVILDLILTDMDGLEVCSKIKNNPCTRSTRIIILSQKRDEKDIIAGLKSGADDYITKPFSMGELEARIMRVMSR